MSYNGMKGVIGGVPWGALPNYLESLAARFWARVDTSGECWTWTGPTVGRGYGKVSAFGSTQRAHRVAWILTNGEIPDGVFVCHRCDNPPCIRPDHLFLGDSTDNVRDMGLKGRAATGRRNGRVRHPDRYPVGDNHWMRRYPERTPRGERHPRAKFTEQQAKDIRAAYATGARVRDLADRYGVSRYPIYQVIHNRTYPEREIGVTA